MQIYRVLSTYIYTDYAHSEQTISLCPLLRRRRKKKGPGPDIRVLWDKNESFYKCTSTVWNDSPLRQGPEVPCVRTESIQYGAADRRRRGERWCCVSESHSMGGFFLSFFPVNLQATLPCVISSDN